MRHCITSDPVLGSSRGEGSGDTGKRRGFTQVDNAGENEKTGVPAGWQFNESWPISRVLSWAIIHLGGLSPIPSSSLPGRSAGHTCRAPIWPCSGRGLPCRGVLPPARCALTAPFHPYLCPTTKPADFAVTTQGQSEQIRGAFPDEMKVTPHLARDLWRFNQFGGGAIGGMLSVALSVGSRRPGVTWRPTLWSPDFPPSLAGQRLPGQLW